jgi:uncharacterized protein (TIGR02677 family)
MKEKHASLFRHVTADKAVLYRKILDIFADARANYSLQLRPDEVWERGDWEGEPPSIDELRSALQRLTEWGNLDRQHDTVRSPTLADYYVAKYIYALSEGGEATETALQVFARALKHKAELQSVALEDIDTRLIALRLLSDTASPDIAKVHEALRDLLSRFEGLAENARGFMADVSRGMELQRSDVATVAKYKGQLIGYIERFLGDLVRRSDAIGRSIEALSPSIESLLWQVAAREAYDAAPDDEARRTDATASKWSEWRAKWKGLRSWFMSVDGEVPQADLLRSRARAAIPQLIGAISSLNERRSGRSNRTMDFRTLAYWFADCASDSEAHRLARAAFALNPARHLSLTQSEDAAPVPAHTRWADAPGLPVNPRLREYGEVAPRGPLPRVRDRSAERASLAAQFAAESRQVEAARLRLCTGKATRLSDLGQLNRQEFDLFLALLGEAIAEQANPDEVIERNTADGLLRIRLQPLGADTWASIDTPGGTFSGRDHLLTISESL